METVDKLDLSRTVKHSVLSFSFDVPGLKELGPVE